MPIPTYLLNMVQLDLIQILAIDILAWYELLLYEKVSYLFKPSQVNDHKPMILLK